MTNRILIPFFSCVLLASLSGCQHSGSSDEQAGFKVTKENIEPGSKVMLGGKFVDLYPGTIKTGDSIKKTLPDFDSKGRVAIVNIVPSIDTPVCEAQTHELGESAEIPAAIHRVAVSRDLPMAQQRFAKEAKLTNIEYISDYKFGTFGKSSGLLMKGPELLARGVVVVDRNGIIRHVQIVPDVSQLPDLSKAIEVAKTLL